MAVFVALLRAVNVGGTGLLPMKELAAMCGDLGFKNARTYIQSGNVIFESALAERPVQTKLEKALETKMGKKVEVALRSVAELQAILDKNPFRDQAPAKVAVLFLPGAPRKAMLEEIVAPGGEQVQLGKRELYIYYPEGMGRSKLKLPRTGPATARNINTVTKLVALAAGT